MSGPSKIEWTGRTWNPVVGCSVISPGCTHCYAMKMAARLEAMSVAHEAAHGGDRGPLGHYRGTTRATKGGAVWTGVVNLAPKATRLAPLRRKAPTTWFVNSMSDLFHAGVPDEVIDHVFAIASLCPQHIFQVLTKRGERMRAYCSDPRTPFRIARAVLDLALAEPSLLRREPWPVQTIGDVDAPDDVTIAWPLPNVWLGVSVEDQRRADERIPHLLATPAAVRFLSCEPLLGPVNIMDAMWSTADPLESLDASINWVIAGGESGKGARPMHPDWARQLRDQCAATGTPFFFKQWGEWGPDDGEGGTDKLDRVIAAPACTWAGGAWHDLPKLISQRPAGDYDVYRLGKKLAGRLLDGVEHHGMPA